MLALDPHVCPSCQYKSNCLCKSLRLCNYATIILQGMPLQMLNMHICMTLWSMHPSSSPQQYYYGIAIACTIQLQCLAFCSCPGPGPVCCNTYTSKDNFMQITVLIVTYNRWRRVPWQRQISSKRTEPSYWHRWWPPTTNLQYGYNILWHRQYI